MGNSKVCIIGTLIKSPNLVYENLQTIQFLLSCKKLENKVDTEQHTLREIYSSVEFDEKEFTPKKKRSSHAMIEQEPALDEIREESESLVSVQSSHREADTEIPQFCIFLGKIFLSMSKIIKQTYGRFKESIQELDACTAQIQDTQREKQHFQSGESDEITFHSSNRIINTEGLMSSEPQIPEELISKLCQCTSFEDAANLLKQLAELIIDQLRDFENLNSVVKSMVYWMESQPSLLVHQQSPPERGLFTNLTAFIAGFEKPFLEILNLLIITKLESIDKDRTHRRRSDIVMQHFVKSLKESFVKKIEELALEITDDVRVKEIFSNLRISLNEMTQTILGPQEFNKSMLLTVGEMFDQASQTEIPLPPLSRRSSRNLSTSTEKKKLQTFTKEGGDFIQIQDVSMSEFYHNSSQAVSRQDKSVSQLQADSSQVEILNQTISKLEINSKERQKRHDDVIGKMKIAILDLNKQLSSERQKNATLEEQLARVNSGMERFKKDNQDESSLIEETYKVKIDSLKDQVVNLKHELGNAESSKLQALRQLSQTENMMEKTVADLEAQLRQSKLAFQELEFQLTKNKTSLKASFLSELSYDKENQPSGINQSSGLQDKELIKKIDTYESTLAQYESEINHNKKSIAKVESLAKEESHKNVTLQHELDRKRARLSKLEDLQEELKLQLSKKEDLCTLQSAEISDLQIKLSSLESQLNQRIFDKDGEVIKFKALEEKIQILEQESVIKDQEAKDLQQRYSQNQDLLRQANQQNAQLTQRLKDNQEVLEQQTNMSQMQKLSIQNLKEQLGEKLDSEEQLRAQLDELQAKIIAMEEEKNESPLKKLERNTSQEKGSPSELKKLQHQLAQAFTELESLQGTIESLSEELMTMKNQCQSKDTKISEIKEYCDTLVEEKNDLIDKIEELQNSLIDIKDELAKKTKVGAISETEEMLEEKIQEFEELQKAQNQTIAKLKKREAEFVELEDKNSFLLQEVTILKSDLQEKQHLIETQKAKIQKLKDGSKPKDGKAMSVSHDSMNSSYCSPVNTQSIISATDCSVVEETKETLLVLISEKDQIIESLGSKMRELTSQKSLLEIKLEAALEENHAISEQLEKKLEELNLSKNQLSELKLGAEFETRKSSETEQIIHNLKNQISQLESENVDCKKFAAECEELRKKCRSLQDQIESRAKHQEMLEEDLREFKDHMRESVDQGRKQSLDLVLQKNSEIEKLASESLKMKQQVLGLEETIQNHQISLDNKEKQFSIEKSRLQMQNESQSLEVAKMQSEIKVFMSKNKALKSNLEQSVLEIKKLSEVLQVLEAKNGESSKSSAALITHNSSVISQLEAQLKSMTEQSSQRIQLLTKERDEFKNQKTALEAKLQETFDNSQRLDQLNQALAAKLKDFEMRDSLRASQLSREQKVKPPGKTHTQQFPQNTTKDILIQELSEYSSDADQSNFYDSNYNLKTNRTQGLGNTYTASKVNTGRKIDYSNSKLQNKTASKPPSGTKNTHNVLGLSRINGETHNFVLPSSRDQSKDGILAHGQEQVVTLVLPKDGKIERPSTTHTPSIQLNDPIPNQAEDLLRIDGTRVQKPSRGSVYSNSSINSNPLSRVIQTGKKQTTRHSSVSVVPSNTHREFSQNLPNANSDIPVSVTIHHPSSVISSSHQKSGTINYHQKSNATPTTFAGTQNNVSNIESPNQPINQPRKISVLSVHSNLGPNHDNSQFLNPEDPRSQYKPVVDYKYSSSNLSTNPLSNLTHFANPSSQRSRSNSLTNSSGALHQDLRPQIVKVVSRANQNNPTPPISGQIYRPVSSYDSQTAQMMPNQNFNPAQPSKQILPSHSIPGSNNASYRRGPETGTPLMNASTYSGRSLNQNMVGSSATHMFQNSVHLNSVQDSDFPQADVSTNHNSKARRSPGINISHRRSNLGQQAAYETFRAKQKVINQAQMTASAKIFSMDSVPQRNAFQPSND